MYVHVEYKIDDLEYGMFLSNNGIEVDEHSIQDPDLINEFIENNYIDGTIFKIF